MLSRTSSASVLLALLLSVLAGLTAAPATATVDDEMGEKAAGRYYLRITCEHNDAAARFQRNAVQPYNAMSTYDQARRRLPGFKREAGIFATATYQWARALMNPPAAWPSSVESRVEIASSRLLRVQNALRSAAGATSARGWVGHIQRASRIWRSVPSATIRAKLDLPAPGRGC